MINKIKSKRALLDLTQAQLAQKIGIGTQSLLNYETKKKIPSILTCLKMAVLFNCPVDDIFELEENEKI